MRIPSVYVLPLSVFLWFVDRAAATRRRVCLEAMEVGTPLACSDLPVLKEVTGDYAWMFDPYDTADIAAVIATALAQKRREAVRDSRFQSNSVQLSFLAAMDAVVYKN